MKVSFSAGITAALILSVISIAQAENYIAVMLEGYEQDCLVESRTHEQYDCKTSKTLYVGDKVTKKPDIRALKIKWAPYASWKELDPTSSVVVFEPPKDKKGVVGKIKDILGLVKTVHPVAVGATRGDSDIAVIPQPGNNATVLPGQKVTFVSDIEDGTGIVFRDSKGMEVFRKDLKGQYIVELSPEEIGMKPEELYTWAITGSRSGKQYKIRLLSPETTRQVKDDLNEIEKGTSSDAEKLINQGTYLQFMSDSYAGDIDLYWLSYRLVEGIKGAKELTKDEKAFLQELKGNYLRHTRETMGT